MPVYSPISDIFSTMRDNSVVRWKVRGADNPPNFPTLGMSDADIPVEESIEKLQALLAGLTGSGTVEVLLSKKSFEREEKGGNLTSFAKFKIEIGGKAVPVGAVNSGGDKELSKTIGALLEANKKLTEQVQQYELEKRVSEALAPLEKKISDLQKKLDEEGEEYEEEETGLFGLSPEVEKMIVPYLPKLMEKITGFVPGAAAGVSPALSGLQYESNEESLKASLKVLTEIYGPAEVAEVLQALAQAAKKNAAQVKEFFPIVKNLANG